MRPNHVSLEARGFDISYAQAPQAAVGFRVVVQKWLVLVRLLLGEVPEREELIEPDLERPLRPYFQLTNAVRIGDLTAFRCWKPTA